jgi:hypothetical protein
MLLDVLGHTRTTIIVAISLVNIFNVYSFISNRYGETFKQYYDWDKTL